MYQGKVKRIAAFGAFVEILPNTDGLLHISEIDHRRIDKVEDVLQLNDVVTVKVIDIDPDGKVRLSRKAILPRGENDRDETSDRGYRSGRDNRGHRNARPDRDRGRSRRPNRERQR